MRRLFTAIDIPDEIRDEICGLHRNISGLKWIPSGQIHMTLRFIGETDDEQFNLIKKALDNIRHKQFSLTISDIGFFPDIKHPNIFWMGTGQSQELDELKNDIDKILFETIGLPPEERAFTPHITLARIKGVDEKFLHIFSSEFNMFKNHKIQINEFILYSSKLIPEGAIHQKEKNYKLMTSDA